MRILSLAITAIISYFGIALDASAGYPFKTCNLDTECTLSWPDGPSSSFPTIGVPVTQSLGNHYACYLKLGQTNNTVYVEIRQGSVERGENTTFLFLKNNNITLDKKTPNATATIHGAFVDGNNGYIFMNYSGGDGKSSTVRCTTAP